MNPNSMLDANRPSLILAPMEGVTNAPMRAWMGSLGAFSRAVSEFIRVSVHPLNEESFLRWVPELANGEKTPTGLPVQVQILGGSPEIVALSSQAAVRAGATAIDLNFGCPAKTVNKSDGGAALLRHPHRIREIVSAVRQAVPEAVPISAKLRLGWESIDDIFVNAPMAIEGGASWLTIHARTRISGYQPPVFWDLIGKIRAQTSIPIVANGDIWTLDDFKDCRDRTGSDHFMIGRGVLANPQLAIGIARELKLSEPPDWNRNWTQAFSELVGWVRQGSGNVEKFALLSIKQWANLARVYGDFPHFEAVKRAQTVSEFLEGIAGSESELSAVCERPTPR